MIEELLLIIINYFTNYIDIITNVVRPYLATEAPNRLQK